MRDQPPGTLHLVGTPIGNLEDITLRALRVLAAVDLIAAEDTRRTRTLLARHGIRTPVVSYFAGNEARRGEEILARLRAGQEVALVSDAGMPGISDPGERLVARCHEAGIPVDVAPGPTALVTALVLSGLPAAGGFRFFGFLPRKGRARSRALAQVAASDVTAIAYESPRRAADTLAALAEAAGPARPAALARELTKLHQEVWRGTLEALAARARAAPPRGEVVLLVGPAPPPRLAEGALVAEVRRLLAAGQGPREIASALAEAAGGRRRAYQAALAEARKGAGEGEESGSA